jgi:hypothetical protein
MSVTSKTCEPLSGDIIPEAVEPPKRIYCVDFCSMEALQCIVIVREQQGSDG